MPEPTSGSRSHHTAPAAPTAATQAPGSPPGYPGKLLTRLLVPYSVVIALAFSVAGGLVSHQTDAALERALETRLIAAARMVAGELQPEFLRYLGPGAEQTRLYTMEMERFQRLAAGARVNDIMLLDPDRRVLLQMSRETPVGAESVTATRDRTELNAVFRGETAASVLYPDADGRFVKTAYAPVLASDGTIFGAVGVVAGADYQAAIQEVNRAVTWVLVIVMVIAGLVSLFLARSIVHPLGRMVRAFGRLHTAGEYPNVPVTTRDELGYLADSFNAMTRRLQQKDIELTRLYELERERAERIENLSELVFEGIPDGLIAADTRGRILLCNRAAAQIIPVDGYPFPETGIPPSAKDVLPPDHPVARHLLADWRDATPVRREDARVDLGDGDECTLGIASFPLADTAGRTMGTVVICSDLTELTRLQEESVVKERLAALGELSAGIAHEIRNPLGAIQGYVELLGRGRTDARDQRIVADVLKAVAGLNQIVTDFLTFAREPALAPESVNPGQLAEEALALAIPGDFHPPIDVVLDVAADLPPLQLDPDPVKRALVNVLQNAVTAMGEAGGRLTLQVAADANGVAFVVTDTGPGVPDAVREKIFNPFFTTRADGTGLGLAIATKVVEGHGGRIYLTRGPQGGARFTFWFPGANRPASPLISPVEAA